MTFHSEERKKELSFLVPKKYLVAQKTFLNFLDQQRGKMVQLLTNIMNTFRGQTKKFLLLLFSLHDEVMLLRKGDGNGCGNLFARQQIATIDVNVVYSQSIEKITRNLFCKYSLIGSLSTKKTCKKSRKSRFHLWFVQYQ